MKLNKNAAQRGGYRYSGHLFPNPPDDIFVSVLQKQPAGGGIYAVRFLILMLKETLKKALEGKVTG